VTGTYRTNSESVEQLGAVGVELCYSDLSDSASVDETCSKLRSLCPQWDALVLCPAALEPIGEFASCEFDQWEESIRVNFVNQMRIVHGLLPHRRVTADSAPCVLLFAGGGAANSVMPNYSAYVVSKVALIKMCELLDSEIPDTRFVIVGPGLVQTKIHQSAYSAGVRAGDYTQRTIDRLAAGDHTPMEKVLDCCDWIVNSPREVVGGRNFSAAFDNWGTEDLDTILAQNPDMYKLRRNGNEFLLRDKS
jgi:NAD(P)-dependent dehydrogenase (short-subunit alcohol dehydrogenase family)